MGIGRSRTYADREGASDVDLTACHYCRRAVVFRQSSDHVYRQDYGPIWECTDCEAWVGCHRRHPSPPLGLVANAPDRKLRRRAHELFDPIWKAKIRREGVPKHIARNAGYAWLSERLGLPLEETHISYMHGAMLGRVIALCLPYEHIK